MDDDPRFKKRKMDYKDIEPTKDILSEIIEEEPKNIQDIKKKLTKK